MGVEYQERELKVLQEWNEAWMWGEIVVGSKEVERGEMK